MTMARHTYEGTSGPIHAADMHPEMPDGPIGGGTVSGVGFTIAWQDGPRGHDAEGNLLPGTGAQVEDVLAATLHRLKQFEGNPTDGEENDLARSLIQAAMKSLAMRRADRSRRGVEGTHNA